MSAGKRRSAGGGGEHHGADERWLLTYADMITLLMCLFIVLWAISSVNTSKFVELQKSLQAAFSHKVLDGGESVLKGEDAQKDGVQPDMQIQPTPQTVPQVPSSITSPIPQASAANTREAASKEQEDLRRVQQEIQEYARTHGLANAIKTTIDERGLVIRLLTDKVLFDSGHATIKTGAVSLLDHVAGAIRSVRIQNPIRVEGHTDNVPIFGGEFRNNWELSAARATAVLEQFLADGISPARVSTAGYADQKPIAPNDTEDGRALNRRVEVVVARKFPAPQGVTP